MQASHIQLFPDDGTIIIAIVNAKTAKGLQQSLSLLLFLFSWTGYARANLLHSSVVSASDQQTTCHIRYDVADPLSLPTVAPGCKQGGKINKLPASTLTMLGQRWSSFRFPLPRGPSALSGFLLASGSASWLTLLGQLAWESWLRPGG